MGGWCEGYPRWEEREMVEFTESLSLHCRSTWEQTFKSRLDVMSIVSAFLNHLAWLTNIS